MDFIIFYTMYLKNFPRYWMFNSLKIFSWIAYSVWSTLQRFEPLDSSEQFLPTYELLLYINFRQDHLVVIWLDCGRTQDPRNICTMFHDCIFHNRKTGAKYCIQDRRFLLSLNGCCKSRSSSGGSDALKGSNLSDVALRRVSLIKNSQAHATCC
jgi:hypothetical protein